MDIQEWSTAARGDAVAVEDENEEPLGTQHDLLIGTEHGIILYQETCSYV
jgi:hypothetical protein